MEVQAVEAVQIIMWVMFVLVELEFPDKDIMEELSPERDVALVEVEVELAE